MSMRWTVVAVILTVASVQAAQTPSVTPMTFVADLRGSHVAPAAVDTLASSKATGVLIGNKFTVHGSFTALSSPLRDIAKTPDDPGVHLHQGAVGETSKYFRGLQVKLNADERSGIFFGTVTLTDDQLKALLATQTYLDIHTAKNGPGEARDQWRPVDARGAERLLAALTRSGPASGARHSAATCH